MSPNGKPTVSLGVQDPDSPPYVSLCVICGDEGAEGLARLFESVLERESGPMFDEVSVYWNGSSEKKPDCLKKPFWETRHGFRVPFVVSEGPWRNDFAWARNISFDQAHGVWLAYMDSDDQVPTADSKSVDEALKIGGQSRADEDLVVQTLREFLKDLPPQVNAVEHPYFYTVIEGLPAVVNPRRRVFRWADGWRWGQVVHEDCFPVRGNIIQRIYHAGFVVEHHPLRPTASRVARNAEILFELERQVGGPDHLDHRSLYGIACFYFDGQDDTKAVDYLGRAMRAYPPPPGPDLFRYRTMAAQACARLGDIPRAIEHAMYAVLAQPDRPMGYLELARCHFLVGNYGESVRWFREGFARKDPPVDGIIHPMAIQGQLRAMGAHALLNLGLVDESVEWAKLAAAADPGAFPEYTLRLANDVKTRGECERAFVTLAGYLEKSGEIQQLAALASAVPAILETGGAAFNMVERLAAEAVKQPVLDAVAESPIPQSVRGALAIDSDTPVVGDRLVRALDPAVVLAVAEQGREVVHVSVPDETQLLPQPVAGRRAAYTPERLHRVLSQRGVVRHLRAVAGDNAQDGAPAGFHLAASYVPGPRRSPKGVGIWCPHFAQQWGPYDPENKGTGGSEEATLYLSRALAKKGYEVTVFGPLPPADLPITVADGVIWRHLRGLDPDRPFDHFIFHRAPAMAATCSWASRHLWSWHHDHFYSEEYWNPRLVASTRHLYVSRWQRAALERLIKRPTAGRTIWNGIPPEQFERAERRLTSAAAGMLRNPKGVAFASMPTRGLDRLLDLWPIVLDAVPDAMLVMYYGTHTVRQLWRGPHYNVTDQIRAMERRVEELTKIGKVAFRGRIGQDLLTEEFLQLGAMAYPTAFSEVYMIAGVRAAAAGMKVVTSDSACLPETMPEQSYMVRRTTSPEDWAGGGRERFALRIIQAITEPESEYDRVAAARRVRRMCSWDKVADRVAAAFDAAESGDTAFFASDVTTTTESIPEGPADMRIPEDPQALESLRAEPMGMQ